MKSTPLLLALLLQPFLSHAAQVDTTTARSVAEHFLQRNTSSTGAAIQLDLAVRMTSAGINPAGPGATTTYYYVFNRHSAAGFIIVAGDDAVTPILGYSDRNDYDPADLPQNMAKWMEGYKQAIAAAIAANASAPGTVQARWSDLAHPGPTLGQVSDRGVGPLLQTQWNQFPYYNAQCPGGSVTGCVATATAQVMKFWNYPATGTGFHSYNSASYGTLSFNYASTTFDWASMPNSISGPNSAIATLMYAVGVGVDMDYSPSESAAYVISSSTGTPPNCAEYALKTYFGYDQSLHGEARNDYSDATWTNMLTDELDNGRPIVYAGQGTSGGHCFVLDGYDDNGLFHVNWGWAGSSDGYFAIDGLNPPALGTGGGAGGFNSWQQAILGIQPPSGAQTFDMQLYDYVTATPNVIGYGQPFSVSTNILNNASSAFAGDYCAAAFDSQGNFVDYVQTLTAQSLPAGYVYTSDLTFSDPGDFAMLPGSYTIGIFYRPTGGNWQQVADAGGYTNFVPFTVVNSNDIEMYTDMDVTSGDPLVAGSAVDVQLDVANYGVSDITATYDLSLYNLDGTFAQTIQQVDNIFLQSGYYYGPMDFTNSAVTAPPGSYLMALEYTTDDGDTWQLVGSTDHDNPVIVTVQAATLAPDIYEVNDDYANAYAFTPSFSNNQAVVNTAGANCHVGTDNDYYAIDLPAGYAYTIDARVNDSYNSGDGNTYSLDALWSYTTDGTTWSAVYDDVMPGTINVGGGTTVHFHCAPYFEGQVGTYDLKATISRSITTGISEETISADDLLLVPVPATDHVDVQFSEHSAPVQSIDLVNAQGQVLRHITTGSNEKRVTIDLDGMAEGVYYVQARTAQGIATRKLVKGE
jgi:hypothetical protein